MLGLGPHNVRAACMRTLSIACDRANDLRDRLHLRPIETGYELALDHASLAAMAAEAARVRNHRRRPQD